MFYLLFFFAVMLFLTVFAWGDKSLPGRNIPLRGDAPTVRKIR